MMSTSGNSRIVKRKLVDGDTSMSFSVVRHVRIMNRPSHIPLATIGTFRKSEFKARAEEFWDVVDYELNKLVKEGKLWKVDRQKVENGFARYIPRPILASPKATPHTLSDVEIMRSVIAEIAEKAERQLAEHGIEV